MTRNKWENSSEVLLEREGVCVSSGTSPPSSFSLRATTVFLCVLGNLLFEEVVLP